MSYDITGANLFFYGGYGTDFGMVHGIIRMKDKIDRDDLQKAVDTAMPRFPYFCTKITVKDDKYCLVPNDAPFVVYEQEEPIPPGDPRVNEYLITFGCWEDALYCDNFHGMGDGRGTTPVIQSVLYYYCLYHYGGPINSPGVLLADQTPDPDEYKSPYDYLPTNIDTKPPDNKVAYFSIPEERVGPDEPHRLFTITMKQDAFVRYTKSIDGSPAVIAALFLCRTIDEVHPEHELPISIGVPVDFRSMLGCPNNKQNCVQSIDMVYDERIRKLPLELQATCFRGMVFVKSDYDTIIPTLISRMEQERFMTKMGISATAMKIGSDGGMAMSPIASYMGKQDFGDIEKYRTEFYSTGDARAAGFLLNIFTAGDNITFSLQYALKDDCYFKALLHQLLLAGVTLTVNPPLYYFPMKRCF